MLSALTYNVVEWASPLFAAIQTLIILGPPSDSDTFKLLLHVCYYISVTAAQNIGNRGTHRGRKQIRHLPGCEHGFVPNVHRPTLAACVVMRGEESRPSGGRFETGESNGASGDGDGLLCTGEGEGTGG